MKGKLVIGVGTLGCKVIARTKRQLQGQLSPRVRLLGIDTQIDEPALQILGPNELFCIGDIPLDAIYKNPAAFGRLTEGIFVEQLANHPPDLKKGGCLYPTATLLGIRFHQAALEGMLSAALGDLLSPENNLTELDVWVVGSNASTTGRGALLEICILLRKVLHEFPGVHNTLSCVVVGCQGLKPDKLPERQALEAGFWLEYNAAMEAHPIPRPHDAADNLWHGMVADHTYYVCAKSSTWQLSSLEHVEAWIAEWLDHTVLSSAVADILGGARIRYRPQIAGFDRGQRDPKCTFLSLAGFAVLNMQLPAVQSYGRACLAEAVVAALLGDPPANTGNLVVSVGLHLGALEERLNFAGYSAVLTQEIARLDRALKEASLSQWLTLAQTSLVNAEMQVKNALDLSPGLRRDIRQDLEMRLQQQLVTQTNGARHIVKTLEDLQQHLLLLHDQAVSRLRTLKRVDQVRTEVNEMLKKTHWFNRTPQREALQETLRGIEDGIRIVLDDNIVRLIDELSLFLVERLKTAREVLNRLEAAQKILQAMAATMLEWQECASVRSLVASKAEFDALISEALTPNNIQVLSDELFTLGSNTGDLLGLVVTTDPTRLIEIIYSRIEAHGYFSILGSKHFLDLFQRQYPTQQSQGALFRWLYDKAEAPGGGVDAGYAQQTRAVPPGEQVRIIVPTELLPLTQQVLTVVVPQLPAGALCGVQGLGLVLATRELHHLPLYAQSYFRRIATALPLEQQARSRYLTAEWSLAVKSYIPYEPFEVWNSRELLLLGLTLGLVESSQGKLAYRDPHIGLPVELGELGGAERSLACNGYRLELVGLIEATLKGREWQEVETGFGPVAREFPEYQKEFRPIYYKLKEEWEQLMKLGRS